MPKKKNTTSGAPGTEGNRGAWKAEADKANGAKPKGKAKGEQLRMKVDSRDAVRVPAKHELHRPMTDAEWHEQTEMHFRERVELMGLEDRIAKLKADLGPRIAELKKKTAQTARELDAHEWLTLTDCIELHDVNTRMVTVYADVGGELGAQVIPSRPMRDDERERALKTSPFEPPDRALDPPDGPPIDIDDATSTKPGIGPDKPPDA